MPGRYTTKSTKQSKGQSSRVKEGSPATRKKSASDPWSTASKEIDVKKSRSVLSGSSLIGRKASSSRGRASAKRVASTRKPRAR